MTSAVPLLEMVGISKRFGPVVANEGVDLTLFPGEVHALVGENGAGKSTLMNVLYGVLQPDAGTILIDGRPQSLRGSDDAIACGLGMVHQHFMLAPSLTLLENAVLGAEPSRFGLLDRRAAEAAIAGPMERLGLRVSPGTITGTMSVAAQQRLEIVKVLLRGARVIILDEPTAVLTPQETEELFVLLRDLAADGVGVIFISHKLKEVFAVADRITVLREGRPVLTAPTAELDAERVVAAMTGRTGVNMGRARPPVAADREPVVLDVRDLASPRPTHDAALEGVSFSVRRGEIVGVAGVEGNGQSLLAEVLIGVAPATAGSIVLGGQDLTAADVVARRSAGMAYVPEDRQREGIPLHGTVIEALAAGRLRGRSRALGLGAAITASVRTWAQALVDRFQIRASGVDVACHALSGGNQQRVVVARELDEAPSCLVLAQPTRGVDLGAIDFLYERIVEEAGRGAAVLLVSADLDELLRLSDRILVMYRGRIVSDEPVAATSPERLGAAMMGLGSAGGSA